MSVRPQAPPGSTPAPQADDLARLYRAGQTIVEIAAATGLGRGTVQRRLKAAGIAPRPAGWRPGRRRRDVGDEDMISRYRSGESLDMIAAAAGVSASTVRRRLREAGVEMRTWEDMPRRTRLELDDRAIGERYRAGETTAAVALSLGVSHHAIRERLIWAGVERRKSGSYPRGEQPGKTRDGA